MSAATTETIPTRIAPSCETAQDRVRDEHHPDHGKDERGAAEEHRTAGGCAGDGDRVELRPSAIALLPIAADDEQRVVDTECEAHAREHVHDEDREVECLSDECGQRERDDDGHERHEYRHEAGDDRAENEEQDDQRGGDAELELSLLKVLLGQALVVLVGGELAGDRRLEALRLSGVDGVDDLTDSVLSARGQGHRDERRVPVGRDERSFAGSVERSRCQYQARVFEVRGKGCDVTLERRAPRWRPWPTGQ